MDKTSDYYQQLLEKWMRSEITPLQSNELLDYLQNDSSSRMLLKKMQEHFQGDIDNPAAIPAALSERLRNDLLKKIEPVPVISLHNRQRSYRWLRVAAAAAIITGIGTALYFAFLQTGSRQEVVQINKPEPAVQDIAPGTNKAVLTLADGTKIELDEKVKGSLTTGGPVSITNMQGQLIYEHKTVTSVEVEYNTLTSARGQSYSLILADGSKLWLNAASSVRFPTAFTGKERQVEITGEVYFDIAKDATRPFHVKLNDLDIEVLGTQFNINSYADEPTINTTLVEGSVKISSKNKEQRLVPGQQAKVSLEGDLKVVNKVNVDEIIAWKNGYFHFDNADLPSILRQFSRWYNIEVEYESELQNRTFFGIIKRESPLSNVLKMLNANDVKFRIEGKRLVVQS